MCCCISGDPIAPVGAKIPVRDGTRMFATRMMDAPCVNAPNSLFWFFGQCLPFTCCCTQIMLRRKVLNYDMSKYQCCQGYFNCCCFKAGSLGEESCPDLCLCIEASVFNSLAVSASRLYVMDKYGLSSDPCDYRIIRINNCFQVLSCVCYILAIFDSNFQGIARIIDRIADIIYHIVSGCMTAQTAYEVDFQQQNGGGNGAQQNYETTQQGYVVQGSAPPSKSGIQY